MVYFFFFIRAIPLSNLFHNIYFGEPLCTYFTQQTFGASMYNLSQNDVKNTEAYINDFCDIALKNLIEETKVKQYNILIVQYNKYSTVKLISITMYRK